MLKVVRVYLSQIFAAPPSPLICEAQEAKPGCNFSQYRLMRTWNYGNRISAYNKEKFKG